MISKVIKVSGQGLQLLHLLYKKMSLSSKTMNYIKIYQTTYKKVTSETQRRENDRIISRSIIHTKASQQIIKTESGLIKKQIKILRQKWGSMSVKKIHITF
jgi:hypothetical protein